MDLLLSSVNTGTVRMMGRYHSKILLFYLHKSTQTFTSGIEEITVQHGYYTLIPNYLGDSSCVKLVGAYSRT